MEKIKPRFKDEYIYFEEIVQNLDRIKLIILKLNKEIFFHLKTSHKNTNIILSVLIMGFMLLIIAHSMLFFIRILKPINRLFKGAKALGKGN